MGFYDTYEELKHLPSSNSNFPVTVFTIPMRNWNLHLLHCNTRHNFVFTIPMRNWNFHGGRRMGRRSQVFTIPMRNWNYSCGSSFCKNAATSFYDTYEELKLFQRNLQFLWIRNVFTIPMRNWNGTWRDHIFFLLIKFLRYLWGIETSTTWKRRTFRICFYDTYEELKLFLYFYAIFCIKVFTIPMRNWNSKM